MLQWIRLRLASLFRRERYERELDAELQFHLDMLTEQLVRGGMEREQAGRTARQRFGQIETTKDYVRDAWLSRLAETLIQDVRSGLRNIRRNPGFAAVVVATLALGIGANTAIFSAVYGVLLRPLPYRDGDRLVVLRQTQPLAGVNDLDFSYQEILDYRRASALSGVVEFHNMWFILLGGPEPERVATGVVSHNFFDVLGVRPLHGRAFRADDERHGAPAVLVLTHAYWQRAHGGDPAIVGRVFQMNDRPHEVIGVLPPVPQYPLEVDVYMPTTACPFRSRPEMIEARDGRMMTALARLRQGVTLRTAQADLDLVAARLQTDHPEHYPASRGYRTLAFPLREELAGSFRTTLLVLLGTAGFVLLIVCASVANLMLARMVRREREMAVRAALGAGRGRLLRQLVTESALLAILGGAVGLALAVWGLDLIVAFASRFTTRAQEIGVDRMVLLFNAAISIGTGLVFGAVPALIGRLDALPALGSGGRTTPPRQRLRSGLIVVQVAASFMLLVGAGLTLRSLLELQQVDPGIRTDNVLTLRIDLNFSKYEPGQRAGFWERIDERLGGLPGVMSAGGAGTFPLNDRGPFQDSIEIEGQYVADRAARPTVSVRLATPGYFETVGQAIVAGRGFTPADRDGHPPVVLVNQTMARHYWPGGNAVGARITGDRENWLTVVGVVADTRQRLNEAPVDEVYVPLFQGGQLQTTWLVRSAVDPAVMARQIRAAVRDVDPEQPVDNFRTLAEVRAASLSSPTLTATLLSLFGLLALVVTGAGLAGVVALSVNQRTQEFGVRMALGAQRHDVLRLVLRQGLRLVLAGLAIGLAGAIVLTRALTALLFNVSPTDALTYVSVAMILVAVAAIACFIPARRAATVDPMVALRVG